MAKVQYDKIALNNELNRINALIENLNIFEQHLVLQTLYERVEPDENNSLKTNIMRLKITQGKSLKLVDTVMKNGQRVVYEFIAYNESKYGFLIAITAFLKEEPYPVIMDIFDFRKDFNYLDNVDNNLN
ncbi:MAG: hypothetical protein IJZ29_04790 [Clostridia bacterium]|nr:hypothetical protein [Clostridia bacterium]